MSSFKETTDSTLFWSVFVFHEALRNIVVHLTIYFRSEGVVLAACPKRTGVSPVFLCCGSARQNDDQFSCVISNCSSKQFTQWRWGVLQESFFKFTATLHVYTEQLSHISASGFINNLTEFPFWHIWHMYQLLFALSFDSLCFSFVLIAFAVYKCTPSLLNLKTYSNLHHHF